MTINTEGLLDKLYNLRGSDSEILKEMNREKQKAEETRNRTTEEKKNLQTNIQNLKELKDKLVDEGEKFKEVLKGINSHDYDTVLDRLHIDFNPQDILDKLERNLPKTIETVEFDTKKAEDELIKVEDEMNKAITTIEELGIRKDTALANQEKLNEYFELSLSGRMNVTRDSITSLLCEFGFNEEEQRETAKILMFPEDALYAYDERVKAKEKSGKSISEVIQEAKTIVDDEVLSNNIVEEKTIDDAFTNDYEEDNDIYVDESKDIKDVVLDVLEENGIDYLDFTSEEIDSLIANFDKETVESNIDFMNDNGIDLDVFINHVSMMYDKELQSKIELLLSIGKESLDIYLNPSILVKYNYDELKNAISLLQGNGMDPKDVPLMAY